MRLNVVGSSSYGNCYFVECDGKYIALDAGCKWKDILAGCDYRIRDVEACFVTHAHSDHCRTFREFVRSGIPVYSNDTTADIMTHTMDEYVIGLPVKRQTNVRGHPVISFYVPHENVTNSAFIIGFPNGEKLLYMTDFECCPFTLKSFQINHFLIAVNHSEEISEDDEAREHRLRGHSSLEVVKDFLKASMTDDCKTVTACHLSGKYADAERIERELREVCGENVAINIARKGMRIKL